MQILTMVGSFVGLPVDDQHSHLDRHNFDCKSCKGRPGWDINVIRPRVFTMSLTGDSIVLFNNILTTRFVHGTVQKCILSKIFSNN